MAKTITDAYVVTVHTSGSAHSNVVRATVEMPCSEWADFITIEDLTNAVKAATTTQINNAGDTGTAQ